ncbi:stage III sporulation protein AG [Qiania dongpingensis]|uniref:stage III sporulation protein AG n=1 Tax=Qiania dongpingensis TaxID=2763669 RepID=UPI002016465D|nr:stage III sporulation protein AG [Qiania dongpingensis]
MKKWNFNFRKLKQIKTETWILLLLAGVLLLVIALPTKKNGENTEKISGQQEVSRENGSGSGTSDVSDYAKKMEKRVAEILSTIDGVGKAEVMVTLESGGETILQTDASLEQSSTKETDSEGGSRSVEEKNQSSQTVLTGSEDSPYVTKELCPKVTGIVITAEGGGEATVKAEISEAMEALFDLPAHKIKVLKRVKQES